MKMLQSKLETIRENEADSPPTKENDLDAIISSLEQFGRFYIMKCVLLCIPIVCSAFNSYSFMFTAGEVHQRCNISQCDSLNSSFMEPWLSFTIPGSNGEWDNCEHFEALPGIDGHCEAHYFNRSQTVGCEAGYKFGDNENTIATEFEIFCTDGWKLSMVGVVNFIGYFIGNLLGGYLSDRYGRKSTLVAAGLLSSLSGLAQSNAPEYYSFLCFECLSMILSSALLPSATLLAMELVSSKHRVMAVMVLTFTNSLAGIALGYLAGYILDWRLLLRVIYVPGLLHLIIVCFLPESVPWLLSQSKEEEAIQVLREIARFNKRPLLKEQLRNLRWSNRQVITQSESLDGHYSIRQILNALGPRISQYCFVWFSNLFIEMGLVLNLKYLSGNKFRNYSLISFLDLPGILIAALLMNRIGRRCSMSLFMASCSTLLIAMTVFDQDYSDYCWYLYFLAKMASKCSYITLYFFTAEVFPTNCRNSMLSLCTMVGGFGYMLAPLTPLLKDFYEYAPHLLFGTFGLIISVLVMFFPETANKVLPSTLKEARDLDRNMPIKHPNVGEISKTSV